jgi:hypothetical protein
MIHGGVGIITRGPGHGDSISVIIPGMDGVSDLVMVSDGLVIMVGVMADGEADVAGGVPESTIPLIMDGEADTVIMDFTVAVT